MAIDRSEMQRRGVEHVRGIDVGASLCQAVDAQGVPIDRSEMQRRVARHALDVGVGASLEECLQLAQGTAHTRGQQGRVELLLHSSERESESERTRQPMNDRTAPLART